MLRSLPNSRRAKRHGEVGKVWQVDETYIRVEGKWCYLYRALESDENLLDSMLRQKQDMDERRPFWGRWIKDCPQISNRPLAKVSRRSSVHSCKDRQLS